MTTTIAPPQGSRSDETPASALIRSLDPAIIPYVDILQRGALPIATSSIADLRAGAKALRAAWQDRGPAMHGTVEDRFAGMRYRIYRPVPDTSLPAVVFFHGGGWTLMDIDTHDPVARLIAAASGAAVLSFEYPLAPEAPFPAGLEACMRFARFVMDSTKRLDLAPGAPAFAGDSAGANLAVATALALRDQGGLTPRALALIYGSYDLSRLDRESHKRFGGGDIPLSLERMELFRKCYVPELSRRGEPLVSPLYAELRGLPPSFLAVASHDPLYDENLAFAARLGAAGNSVELKIYPGTVHGFIDAAVAVDAPIAKRTVADIGRFLASAFG